jgi:hypothetical protein
MRCFDGARARKGMSPARVNIRWPPRRGRPRAGRAPVHAMPELPSAARPLDLPPQHFSARDESPISKTMSSAGPAPAVQRTLQRADRAGSRR